MSDVLELKKGDIAKYEKCTSLECEFVQIKCEIELMKSKNLMLLDEARMYEGNIEYYD